MVDTPENTEANTEAAAKPIAPVHNAAEAVDAAVNTGTSGFNKAIEDAKASAAALKEQAIERSAAVREKVTETASDWSEQAVHMAAQAKEKGIELANQGKTKASEALASVGTVVAENAGLIDEKLGVQYGDYARGTAKSIKETAARLEAKELSELGDDVAGFVRKSPATALGIAAFSGFLIARLFRRSGSSDT